MYCPLQEHTLAEGTVFYLRMLHGKDFVPPDPTGIFIDVPIDKWYARWVEAAYAAEIVFPCSTDKGLRACPEEPLTRTLAGYIIAADVIDLKSVDPAIDAQFRQWLQCVVYELNWME